MAALIREHAAFPRGRHDDTVDAASQGFNWLASTRQLRGRIGRAASLSSLPY